MKEESVILLFANENCRPVVLKAFKNNISVKKLVDVTGFPKEICERIMEGDSYNNDGVLYYLQTWELV